MQPTAGGSRVGIPFRAVADRLRRTPLAYHGIAVAYVVLRIVAIAGTPAVGDFPDSATYRQGAGQLTYPFVSFAGHAMRPWAAPLLYWILPTDNLRADVQVALSIVAWLVLATTIALALRDRRVRLAAFTVILALSCTAAITSWDRAILAESTSISLGALALSAWIRFAWKPSVANSAAVVVTMTFWSFTKAGTFPVVGLAALLVAASTIRSPRRLMVGAVAAALALVCAWSIVADVRSDKTYEQFDNQGLSQFNINFANELRLHILADPSDTVWFVAHGMPSPVGLTAYRRASPADDGFVTSFPSFVAAYTNRPDLIAWGNSKGQHVYAEFVLTHPHEFASQFSNDLPYLLTPPRNAIVYVTYVREVLPSELRSYLFDSGPGSSATPTFGDVGLLAGAAVALAIASRRRIHDRRLLTVGGAGLVLSFVALGTGWVLSPVELGRHALPASVILRVSLWILVFGPLDALLTNRPAAAALDQPS